MAEKVASVICFRHAWRGREPGHIDRALEHGVMDALVRRGVAVWHEEKRGKDVEPAAAKRGSHGSRR